MKEDFCREIGCPRYIERGSTIGVTGMCQANENMDQIGTWRDPVESITNEQCRRLRRLLKARKEVQA